VAAVHFTRNLDRHVACPPEHVDAATAREALDAYFALHPAVHAYVLDERGMLRTHVNVFVDGVQVADRARLDDPVGPTTEIYVMQALSGGCSPERTERS
jgi:molybdopterin synthase sulfur carrier subunit